MFVGKQEEQPEKPVPRSESEVDETFNRLVNEFWDIRARKERAE
jgi:hypothetical protein